jgi:predicted transcriptional regulator
MAEKGLVTRDESARTHVYTARASQEHTQRQLLNDLVRRAFGGSAAELVLRALSTHRTSESELREIRKMIDEAREERR